MNNDTTYRGFPESERIRRIESRERWKVYAGDPNGVVSAGLSMYCWDVTNDNLYVNNDGATGWTFVGGASSLTGSGVATRVAFWSAASVLSSDAELYWDNVNKRLGVGTASPDAVVHSEYEDAATNNQVSLLRLTRTSTGAPAFLFGGTFEVELEDSGGTNRIASSDITLWVDSAPATFSAFKVFTAASGGVENVPFIFIQGSSTQPSVAINGNDADIDFQVHGDTDSRAIFMQASSNYTGIGKDPPATRLHIYESKTLAASPADGYSSGLTLEPVYSGAFTVTRHNYIDVMDAGLAGGAALTNGAVMRFDQGIGTHCALAAAFSTGDSNSDLTNWAGGIIVNVNGTLYKVPMVAL